MGIASVALLTIGQTPRPDMTTHIRAAIPASVKVVEVGLLDGMTRAEAEAGYAPQAGEMPLVTLLRDGRVISISSSVVRRSLQVVMDRLVAEGIGAIVLLCTGPLPDLRAGAGWLVQPDAIVPAVLAALIPGSRLGVILPAQEQVGAGSSKWDALGEPPLYAAASPYDDDLSALVDTARRLVASGAQAIVLDCMGYGARHQDALRRVIDQPVVVSSRIVAGVLTSLF